MRAETAQTKCPINSLIGVAQSHADSRHRPTENGSEKTPASTPPPASKPACSVLSHRPAAARFAELSAQVKTQPSSAKIFICLRPLPTGEGSKGERFVVVLTVRDCREVLAQVK